MDHIAIMKKRWGLLEKILSGEKTIESRWYKTRRAPWGQIKPGDTVWFKNSGEPVTVRAVVKKILEFEDLTPEKVREILDKYGEADGVTHEQIPHYYDLFKNKKYCMPIFLKGIQKVKPFNIDKSGFGAMAAWISVDKINLIRV